MVSIIEFQVSPASVETLKECMASGEFLPLITKEMYEARELIFHCFPI
jgi:hypothetical protein